MNRHEALNQLSQRLDSELVDETGAKLVVRVDNREDADEQLVRAFEGYRQWASGLTLEGHRLDAGESALLARELLYVQQKQVFIQYSMLKSARFIPIDTSMPAGVDSFSTEIYKEAGSAKLITNYATDFPSADVFKEEHIQKCFGFGNSYRYSIQDLRRSALSKGQPLDQRRAGTARMVHDRLIDRTACLGDTASGLIGIAGHSSVTVLDGSPDSLVGDWATASADQMFADLALIENTPYTATLENMAPDTLLLAPAPYNILFETPANDFTTETVGQVFLRSRAKHIKNIDRWDLLTTAGGSSSTRAICYKRDPQVIDQKLPLAFQMSAPQQVMLAFTVPCESRFGGTVLYYPAAMVYADGL